MPSRTLASSSLALAALLAAGCPDPGRPDEGAPDAGPVACQAGERFSAELQACESIAATLECPAGTMPQVGSEGCVPVGWVDCPAGFEPSASGWGCEPVLPSQLCLGATVERLGERACQPLGDCEATFPPPEATVFVNPAFRDDEVGETRFHSIAAAVAKAPSGSTIAVEAGLYEESIALTRPMTIVGRCAEKVVVKSTGGVAPGVDLRSSKAAKVKGVTLTGHRGGALVSAGGELTLEECLLEANRDLGVFSVFAGSRIRFLRSAVRGTLADSQGRIGRGAEVEGGASLEVVDSLFAGNRDVGVFGEGPGTTIRLTRTIVRDTDGTLLGAGRGLIARKGAQAEVEESVLLSNRDVGAFTIHPGSSITMARSAILRTRTGVGGQLGRGVEAQTGAALTLTDCLIAEVRDAAVVGSGEDVTVKLERVTVRDTNPDDQGMYGSAIFLREGTVGEVRSTAMVRSHSMAITVLEEGTSLTLSDSLVSDTRPEGGDLWGMGAMVMGGARGSISGSTFERNHFAGVISGPEGGSVSLARVLVRRSLHDAQGTFGFGLLGWDRGELRVSATVVSENAAAGMLFDNSKGLIASTTVQSNPVGILAQNGSVVLPLPEGTGPADGQVLVSEDTRFLKNAANTGGQAIALPDAELPLH